jgi:uncharacterized protein (DUF433 family)
MSKTSVVRSDPDILGGTPVFVGTRVPVQALIDYIEGGHSLKEFLDDFPTVTREVAVAALERAKEHLHTAGNGNSYRGLTLLMAKTACRAPRLT